MKKSKVKRSIIEIEPVGQLLYLYYGESENIKKEIENDFNNIGSIHADWDGFHAFLTLKSGEQAHLIYISTNDAGLIVHEIIHCIYHISEITGIKDDEYLAYQGQHLFNKISSILK